MKLRIVKWANHPMLENLELDFTTPEGESLRHHCYCG